MQEASRFKWFNWRAIIRPGSSSSYRTCLIIHCGCYNQCVDLALLGIAFEDCPLGFVPKSSLAHSGLKLGSSA